MREQMDKLNTLEQLGIEEANISLKVGDLLDGLVYFCLRVEEGSVRSRTTYRYYKEIIEESLDMEWEEVKEVFKNRTASCDCSAQPLQHVREENTFPYGDTIEYNKCSKCEARY